MKNKKCSCVNEKDIKVPSRCPKLKNKSIPTSGKCPKLKKSIFEELGITDVSNPEDIKINEIRPIKKYYKISIICENCDHKFEQDIPFKCEFGHLGLFTDESMGFTDELGYWENIICPNCGSSELKKVRGAK